MKKSFSALLLIAFVFGLRFSAVAQSCTTAVCNAASANESAVLAALPSSSNNNATVVVNIPAGTASWTLATSITRFPLPSPI